MSKILIERKYADVSTRHMTFADSKILSQWAKQQRKTVSSGKYYTTVHDYLEGFYVYVGNKDNLKVCKGVLSDGLLKLLLVANKEKFAYVNFDRDGEEYVDFEVHEW